MNKDSRTKYAEAWMCYLSGTMTFQKIAEILDIPYNTLLKHASTNHWHEMRKKIHKEAGQGLKKDLAERIEKARIAHQEFMLEQLEETASGIENKVIGYLDPEDQKGEKMVKVSDKLDLLEQQHRVAANVLRLDEQEKPDTNKTGFEFLMRISATSDAQKTIETTPSAILPLVSNSEATTGILSALNGTPDESHNPDLQSEKPSLNVFEVVEGIAEPVKENTDCLDAAPPTDKLTFK